jgi:hypothetical protein
MPNRVIKEQILTSPNYNMLSTQGENHFVRLLVTTDDYGCFEATPDVVKGKCYPKKPKMTVGQIIKAQQELGECHILNYWYDKDRIYGVFINFEEHNARYCVTEDGKPTRHRRKTPEPDVNTLTNDFRSLVKKLGLYDAKTPLAKKLEKIPTREMFGIFAEEYKIKKKQKYKFRPSIDPGIAKRIYKECIANDSENPLEFYEKKVKKAFQLYDIYEFGGLEVFWNRIDIRPEPTAGERPVTEEDLR